MESVFADTQYWIAICKPGDQWSLPAKCAREALGQVVLVTTDEVLTEFLAALSRGGSTIRHKAASVVHAILRDSNVVVVPQSREGFLGGLKRYEDRDDKAYSLTDCVSMNVMESQSLKGILTNDRHFEQEGFTVLIHARR